MSKDDHMSPCPVHPVVGFDPVVSKWESNRHYADWCGPGCVVQVPASDLYHILDLIHNMKHEVEIAKAERNREHVVQYQKAMDLVRQAEDGRQYWMHAALGRETDGDARDAELLRLAIRLREVESNPQTTGPAPAASPATTTQDAGSGASRLLGGFSDKENNQ